MSTIGERIQKARKRAGLSQGELAALCGWSGQGRVSHYETGRRRPTLEDIGTLARALRVTPEELVSGADPIARIPVIGDETAIRHSRSDAPYYLPVPSFDPQAFAIRIAGRGFLPRFRPGEMLLVEPTQKPTPGDEVVVVQPGGALRIVEFIRVTKNEMFVRTIIERHDEIIPLADLESSGTVRGIYRSTLIRSGD